MRRVEANLLSFVEVLWGFVVRRHHGLFAEQVGVDHVIDGLDTQHVAGHLLAFLLQLSLSERLYLRLGFVFCGMGSVLDRHLWAFFGNFPFNALIHEAV